MFTYFKLTMHVLHVQLVQFGFRSCTWLCYDGKYNPLNFSLNRTYSAGRPHAPNF